jgi:hypothetical protein
MPDKSRSEKVRSALGAFHKGYSLGGAAARAISGRGAKTKSPQAPAEKPSGEKVQYESRKGSGPPKVGPAPVVNVGPKQGGSKALPRKPKKATRARGVRKVAVGY